MGMFPAYFEHFRSLIRLQGTWKSFHFGQVQDDRNQMIPDSHEQRACLSPFLTAY
jgi:hypothetical protein